MLVSHLVRTAHVFLVFLFVGSLLGVGVSVVCIVGGSHGEENDEDKELNIHQ